MLDISQRCRRNADVGHRCDREAHRHLVMRLRILDDALRVIHVQGRLLNVSDLRELPPHLWQTVNRMSVSYYYVPYRRNSAARTTFAWRATELLIWHIDILISRSSIPFAARLASHVVF